MYKYRLPFSILSTCYSVIGVLVVVYIGLIAVVMSYAALTVEFTQSVRNSEAEVASLESEYLNNVAHITSIDYAAAGYAKPQAQLFVRSHGRAALR